MELAVLWKETDSECINKQIGSNGAMKKMKLGKG